MSSPKNVEKELEIIEKNENMIKNMQVLFIIKKITVMMVHIYKM